MRIEGKRISSEQSKSVRDPRPKVPTSMPVCQPGNVLEVPEGIKPSADRKRKHFFLPLRFSGGPRLTDERTDLHSSVWTSRRPMAVSILRT